MKNYYLITLIAALSIIITISSCKKNDDPILDEALITVDSIVHQDTVNIGGTLNIKFYGVLGDGCDFFSRFEDLELDENDIANTFKISIWKKREDNGACTELVKYLDDAQLNLTGMLAGDFVIKVVQPDGSQIVEHVFIK